MGLEPNMEDTEQGATEGDQEQNKNPLDLTDYNLGEENWIENWQK